MLIKADLLSIYQLGDNKVKPFQMKPKQSQFFNRNPNRNQPKYANDMQIRWRNPTVFFNNNFFFVSQNQQATAQF